MNSSRYFTGKPCPQGHVSERYVRNRECVICRRERSARDPNRAARAKASAERHRLRRNAEQQARYWADVERSREYQKEIRLKNLESYTAREAEARKKGAEHRREYFRRVYAETPHIPKAASKRWSAANLDKVAARTARRKAARLRATPAWANMDEIMAFYALARNLTEATGVPHEVDHIMPLQGKHVCGLHVQNNLQILTKSENSRKRNYMIAAALIPL